MVEETRERIMDATYRALCEYGYASLTMQDIADECDCSTSLLHYHFDTKDDLLVALLDHLISRFEERVSPENDDPRDQLVDLAERARVDAALDDGGDDGVDVGVVGGQLLAERVLVGRLRAQLQ